ncbi:MAG: Anhydro-N-acetylmuramic acid kinase (EC [uncultured Sulfurovum sp.]|uniref:Anhydro-N-acetylmuramic acid kinase n=1 Tax=uncultured Sulfurovum sp. TaxID=269237 RepID=A0A6S6TZF9_9BACT|nr:MAG: Anhydro-N-acetylmuramic acid kinase (EC [uncultured Sulfurovum sp.]
MILSRKMRNKYIGIMSGTSLDGVDVALCEIDDEVCLLKASYYLEFDLDLKEEVLRVINGTTTIQEIGTVDCKLAYLFARAVNELLENSNYKKEEIRAIGSHGQTLWHEPHGKFPFSLQLGNPSVLAVETGIDVVADFRSKDVALGGQGAPFAPAFHNFLFSHLKNCAVLNIGGMANISILGDKLLGYDTGCGNVLMDLWIKEHQNVAYDKDGAWAKSGEVNQELLSNFLNDEYFLLKFPKSTGREYFNKKFLIKYLEAFDKICNKDVQATLLALTASSIANEIRQFNIKELLVCGGGVRNIFLMEQLREALPKIKVSSTEKYGISADNMEAMIFAWLAHNRLENEIVDLKTVTAAKKNIILGAIYASD